MWMTILYFSEAYVLLLFRKFISLPIFFWIIPILLATLIASAATFNRAEITKLLFAFVESPSFQLVDTTLQQLHKTGNAALAEHLYQQISQSSVFSKEEHQKLNLQAYPKAPLEKQRVFWETVYVMQPDAKQALVALSKLSLLLKDQESAEEYLEKLRYIEPNDERIIQLEIKK